MLNLVKPQQTGLKLTPDASKTVPRCTQAKHLNSAVASRCSRFRRYRDIGTSLSANNRR